MEVNGFNTVVLIFGPQNPEMNIDVFSYYNAKLTVYATSITGRLSKMAALLFEFIPYYTKLCCPAWSWCYCTIIEIFTSALSIAGRAYRC